MRPGLYLERGEDKNAEFCLWLLIFAGAAWDELRENAEIGENIGPISKLTSKLRRKLSYILAKSVMKVKPETVELSGEKTAPKYTFSFPAKVNFQFSQRWENSIQKLLDENFDSRHRQSG